MDIKDALHFADSRAWRKWLEKNHDTSKGVWLVHYKKDSGQTSARYDDALDEALCFGWIDSIMKSLDDDKFVLKYTPRKGKSVWSERNKDKAERLIASGRMTPAGLAMIEEAKKNGLWQNAYSSKRKEKMPPDLKKALLKDSDAWRNFHNFANSYWNMYIAWINDAKTEKTRAIRISEVVRRSAINKKPG
jgi:uncharacterized protein YdeI (YjbR/CyaY-like superfamily)